MAARQSRASRAAAQAGQDVVVPIGGGKGATGDNGGGRKPAATSKPAVAKPEAAKPKVTVGTKQYDKPFFLPVVNGKAIECEHAKRYGHDSEKAALACAKKLAAA